MVNIYSKNDRGKPLSKDFRVEEFACKCGKCGKILIDGDLVELLQAIRTHFGKAVTVTSGCRCESHNRAVGGVSGSLHTRGMAADITVRGIAPAEVARYAEEIGAKGIGLYEGEDGDFVHIDTRSTKSFWYGHKQEHRETFREKKWYRIRKSWGDASSQLGAYESLDGAVKACPAGYRVYDDGGTQVYPCGLTLPMLRSGDSGETVRALQLLLMGRGYSCGKRGADGEFGAGTDKALRHFQADKGLPVTGKADGETWKALLGLGGSA